MIITIMEYGINGESVKVIETKLTLKEVWLKLKDKTFQEDQEFIYSEYGSYQAWIREEEKNTSFTDTKIIQRLDEYGFILESTEIETWKEDKVVEEVKKQSIPNNTEATFNLISSDFFKDLVEDLEELEEHDEQDCIVNYLETYTELGNKDFEYYNISFKDGYEIEGCSGLHLMV